MRYLTGESSKTSDYMPVCPEALQAWLCREALATGEHYRGSNKKKVTYQHDFTL